MWSILLKEKDIYIKRIGNRYHTTKKSLRGSVMLNWEFMSHWGVLSVPAYANDWYPRNMHIEGTDEYKHHVEIYGKPSKFGYHDFAPMFKAEKFKAEEWVELFQKTGAKFGGLVAESKQKNDNKDFII